MDAMIWVLEDQLSPDLEVLRDGPGLAVFMVESARHFASLPYHKHRIVLQASAMRHFAAELAGAGREVLYYPLRRDGYLDSVSALRDAARRRRCRRILLTDPADRHTRDWAEAMVRGLGLELTIAPNRMFLTDRAEFAQWARGLKSPVMEPFYRRMRARHDVLMEGGKPVGGKWNFDQDNRKAAPRGLRVPPLPRFPPDAITSAVALEVGRRFAGHPGEVAGFSLPVTRGQALAALEDFLARRLPSFGDYEDAMVTGAPVLFHSWLAPLLNLGLLSPMECIRAAEARYRDGSAPLNSVEGFVRQILGWREYVYGIYHAFMPEYRERNARGDRGELPGFFWTGETEMNCLRQTIGGVLRHAYTHHIQRLMVLCNYATLAGLSPQAVNDWFLAMYADSHDWVVTPNVIGMGMNADGGTMATKPYVSSGAYINRMSDYCRSCRYDVRARSGDGACPFNYLFWTFLSRHRRLYERNPRMTMMLRGLERIEPEELAAMQRSRRRLLGG